MQMPAGFLRNATFEGPAADGGAERMAMTAKSSLIAVRPVARWLSWAVAVAPRPAPAGAAGPAGAAAGRRKVCGAQRQRMADAHARGLAPAQLYRHFVVSSNTGSMSSARIWHACEGDLQVERVESLTGAPRSTFRRNEKW